MRAALLGRGTRERASLFLKTEADGFVAFVCGVPCARREFLGPEKHVQTYGTAPFKIDCRGLPPAGRCGGVALCVTGA